MFLNSINQYNCIKNIFIHKKNRIHVTECSHNVWLNFQGIISCGAIWWPCDSLVMAANQFGAKSIDEKDWKPHNMNIESNPNAVLSTARFALFSTLCGDKLIFLKVVLINISANLKFAEFNVAVLLLYLLFWVILRVKRNSNGQEIIRVLMLIFYFVGNVKCLYLNPRFINTKGLVNFSLAQWKLGCFWLPLLALIKSWYYGSTFWLFCNMIKANDIFTKTKNGQKQHPFLAPTKSKGLKILRT